MTKAKTGSADILSKSEVKRVLEYLSTTTYPTRNTAIFLMSFLAGMRSVEISRIEWKDVCSANGEIGDTIQITKKTSKGGYGSRSLKLHSDLKSALISYKEEQENFDLNQKIFSSQRSKDGISSRVIINMFRIWYDRCGLPLASSHSGRRTFATQIARNLSRYGASIRDLSMVLGHSNIRTTSRYIEPNKLGMTKLIEGL
tara:strand:+ start:53 stop:652 length:600 start_codon:yes stop_codon:yes gene_type:complete